MKTKYALMNDDKIIAIFNDLADAEEMYLDLLEEAGYEHCCRYVSRDGFYKNLEEYYNGYYKLYEKAAWETFEGIYLYIISGGCFPMYRIEEGPYFEN